MELSAVAEGVKIRGALDRLIEMECEMVRGYYLSRPLPPDGVIAKIEEFNDLAVGPDETVKE